MTTKELEQVSKWVRRTTFEMCMSAGAGHIAPAMSATDIFVALYHGGVMNVDPQRKHMPERDRFILSKGQGCAALYAVLAHRGFFPVKDLLTYTQEGSYLGGHSESNVPGVEAFTGSLGNGLGIGVGMALVAKQDKLPWYVYVMVGDGECNEGAIWESAMFAAHHKLDNLVVIVDRNNQQAVDFTKDAIDMEPMTDKWRAFGFDTYNIMGHDFDNLLGVFHSIKATASGKPRCVIAHTTKGKGISFMEKVPIWHYKVPDEQGEIAQARKELHCHEHLDNPGYSYKCIERCLLHTDNSDSKKA